MMLLRRSFSSVRHFSVSKTVQKSYLSADYKSQELWRERFKCKYVNATDDIIKAINNKIIMGSQLTNLEVDIFINIASGSKDEIAQLQESVQLVQKLRQSIYAHTLLPSTQHAFCRLFLQASHLQSLLSILDNRVRYGIFPDFFSMNLLLDAALDSENLPAAAKLASLIMLQEEFGLNPITDSLSALSLIKYIESGTNFSDWPVADLTNDPIFLVERVYDPMLDAPQIEEETKTKSTGDEEDEEEDAQYVRVPWLRNPFSDGHFDLTEPRAICAKALTALGASYLSEDQKFGESLQALGQSLGEDVKSVAHQTGLAETAEKKIELAKQFEQDDIEDLRKKIAEWSSIRDMVKTSTETAAERQRLIEELKRKKQELAMREQYLYFYDELKRKSISKIEYN